MRLKQLRDIEECTVFVKLLEEGTDVYRPVPARIWGDGETATLLEPDDYESADETWQYPPGSVVCLQRISLSGAEVLAAVSER